MVDLKTVSSKFLRDQRANPKPICIYRSEAPTWALKASKVTSIRHRSNLLRVAHKEVYTKEKLCRFRFIDSPNCSRCPGVEDFLHKIFDTDCTKRIWEEIRAQ